MRLVASLSSLVVRTRQHGSAGPTLSGYQLVPKLINHSFSDASSVSASFSLKVLSSDPPAVPSPRLFRTSRVWLASHVGVATPSMSITSTVFSAFPDSCLSSFPLFRDLHRSSQPRVSLHRTPIHMHSQLVIQVVYALFQTLVWESKELRCHLHLVFR
jgi:hypothetical protein